MCDGTGKGIEPLGVAGNVRDLAVWVYVYNMQVIAFTGRVGIHRR